MRILLVLLISSTLMAQSSATHSPTVLRAPQLPPVAQPTPALPLIQETPQPGSTPNTWTLAKPVTNILLVWWHGVLQGIGGTYVFSGTGTGGTLLTLTPDAIALGFWQDNAELIAVYQ